MKNHYHVYIASPFFNPEQLDSVERVKAILENKRLTYYSPKDEAVVAPDADHDWREKVFADNCLAIQRADFVFAITDGKDPGTLWEAGYAFGINKPIVYLAETLGPNGQFNLMLAQSGVAAFTEMEKADQYLKSSIEYENGIINMSFTQTAFEGLIE